METLRYDYRPKAWVMALKIPVFAILCFSLGKAALANDRGLILNGFIRLDIGGATIFYSVCFVVCALALTDALYGIVRAFRAPEEVVLDATSITAPRGMFNRVPVTVPFTHFTFLGVTQVNWQKMLIIRYPGGALRLWRSMLATRNDFEELAEALGERCRAAGMQTSASPTA